MTTAPQDWRGLHLLTVGHSTRSQEELVELLQGFDVTILADVRTVPRSRRNPWFAREALSEALPRSGIRYVHLAALGGLRHAKKDSPNAAWRNASFRGYADYMQTDAFEEGLAELRALCQEATTAVMCAEAVYWRCHRSLIADVTQARGARVEHIMGPGKATPHRLTAFAQVEDGRVTYPAQEGASD